MEPLKEVVDSAEGALQQSTERVEAVGTAGREGEERDGVDAVSVERRPVSDVGEETRPMRLTAGKRRALLSFDQAPPSSSAEQVP